MDGTTLIIINMLIPAVGAIGLFAALRMRRETPAVVEAPARAPGNPLDPRS